MRKTTRGQKIRIVRVFFVPLLAAGFAFGLVTAATELTKGPIPEPAAATSIVWADRVFSTTHDMKVWLRAKGMTYEKWAALHPDASAVLERNGRKAATGPAPSTASATRAAGVSAKPDNTTLALVVLAASILGILLLLVALRTRMGQLAPKRSIRTILGPPRRRDARRARARPVTTRPTEKARRRIAISVPRMTLGPSLRRGLRTGPAIPLRRSRGRTGVDAEVPQRGSIITRAAVRRYAPDVALYVTSALLACVIGISIALYN